MSVEVEAASGQHERRALHCSHAGGLTPLHKAPRKRWQVDPEVAMRKAVQQLAEGLPRLAAEGQWLPLMRATHFLLWLTQHAPGSAAVFIHARGTVRLQDVIRAAAGSADPAAVGMLQPGTALLLHCVRLSESAADLVVESQSVRLLLQLLLRHDVGPATKRHTGDILQELAATKLVYRDVLHGAGIVETLLGALTDASCLADLTLLQKLLWVLISLSDDDDVYKDDMREAGLPALLVALFSVYQAHQGAAELRPIAAQILRCLHLMAHDDAPMQRCCRSLGLIRLLANQLHCDIHSLDEPPLPPAAANILTLSNCPSTPKSPHKLPSSGGGLGPGNSGGGVSPGLSPSHLGTPGSPMRRSGSGNSSSGGSPRVSGLLPAAAAAAAASHGRRPSSAVEPPIPEDAEADLPLPDSPVAAPAHLFAGRSAYAPHSTEAAALRGLGAGPSPLTRLSAALLLRVVLADVMSPRTLEVLLHGVLLPALHMQLVGPRLSLAAEATAALRALLADCPANQEAAEAAGVVPLVVQLMSARNIDLASTAAEVVTILAARGPRLGPLTPAAVSGLAGLLKECAAHAYMLGLGRRRSSIGGSSMTGASSAQQTHAAATADMLLRPIPEAGIATGSGSNGVMADSAAEHAAGAAWSERSAAQHHQLLQPVTSVVMRHPSLNRDGTVLVAAQQQQQQAGFLQQHHYQQPQQPQQQVHLSSRERPRFSMGPGGAAGAAGPSGSCLVCQHTNHDSCGFCPLSSALSALLVLCKPASPQLQSLLMDGGCLTVVVGLIAGELGGPALEHSRLLVSLAELLSLAVVGNSAAQDLVRLSGGVDVLVAAFNRLAASAAARDSPDAPQLCTSLLALLAALAAGNSANKLCMREAGAFSGMSALLDLVLQDTAAAGQQEDGVTDQLASALLAALASCLLDSPGSQAAACQLGIPAKLLALLRLPCPATNPGRGLAVIRDLALLGHKGQPAAQAELTAGGLVAVVMNVLQQQAMAGVLVAEVCMTALPTLIDGNPTGKQQALQYGLLPLLVHLLRSSPSPVTLTAAAQTLAVLAHRDTELQGQITAAGGLTALLDKLDPANSENTASGAAEAQAAATAEAAAAAAAAAAEAVARGLGGAEDSCSSSSAADGGVAEGASQQQQQQPLPGAAASIFSAVEGAAVKQSQQPQPQPTPDATAAADAAAAAANYALDVLRIKVACLEAVAALAHDNMFVKNTARQQGVMLLLVDLLRTGSTVLQAAVAQQQHTLLQKATPRKQQQYPYPGGGGSTSSSPRYSHLEHSSSYWSGGQGQLRVRTQSQPGAAGPCQEQQQEQLQQQQQLAMLVAAVRVLCELCHGNHSNQQAAASEGLLDQLTSLAALALGDSLEAAAQHRRLLSAIADAIAAASEFCIPNKLVARESGAVDVLSRLLLMAAEAPDMAGQLTSLRLCPVVASACGAVVALSQDCEDDQRAFTSNPDFLPALFRLLSVDDPAVATQAARALEFIAIRNDYAEDADDRPEFEADTALALIRTLTHGAIAISGSGRGAAARVTTGPGGPGSADGPSAAVIKAASDLLALVVEASDPAQLQGTAAGSSSDGAGSRSVGRTVSGPTTGSNGSSSIAASGLGTAPAHPAVVPAGATSKRQLQPHQGSAGASHGAAAAASASSDGPGGVSGIDPLSRPAALMPAVVTDHTSGLAVLRTWSLQEDMGGLWQALVARTAPAFQHIRTSLPEGPWKPFRLQVGWMLLLLAAKNANNRAIISRIQRTTLAPLAMQLENAERFYQVAAEAEAASEAAAAAAAAAGGSAGAHAAQRGSAGAAQQQPPSSSQPVAGLPASGTAVGGADSLSGRPSMGGPSAEDDEMSMLQAEVAFLGLHSSSRKTSMDG